MEDTAMIKKNYMQPTIQVVKIQTAGMLAISGTQTEGLGGDNMDYDENGEDPGDAMGREMEDFVDEEW
jgi:hypothetical protein